MASSTHTPQAAPVKRTRVPQLTLPQLKKSLADNKPAFDAYETARLAQNKDGVTAKETKRLQAIRDKNHSGFTVYWRGFNDPRMVAARAEARAKKAAAA